MQHPHNVIKCFHLCPERNAVVLGQAVARRKGLVALVAVKDTTIVAVGDVSQKRLARHVLRPPTRLALLALKTDKLVFVHKVSDQQRLVRADGIITQRTVALVITVIIFAHFAAANMVVEQRNSLERPRTHAARGEGVALLGMGPLIFLFHHDVFGTTWTLGFDLVGHDVRHKVAVVRIDSFPAHSASRKPVSDRGVLFFIRHRNNLVANFAVFHFVFMGAEMPVKNPEIGVNNLVADWASRKPMNDSCVIACVPDRHHKFTTRTLFWFFLVRLNMSIKNGIVRVDAFSTKTDRVVMHLDCMLKLFSTHNIFIARD